MFILLVFIFALSLGQKHAYADSPVAKYVILLIADGWGINQINAANDYAHTTPPYQSWPDQYWMSTYPAGGGYDTTQAWTNFNYVLSGYTDSAAAATALYTGVKTNNGKITVSTSDSRLTSIGDKARGLNKAVGAVSSVQISHATPGAWQAHNDVRTNGYAIADEGLFGHPNTTGISTDPGYGGGHGSTLPAADVVIGGGHPAWNTSYVNNAIRNKLVTENGQPGKHTFVERISGSPDGGTRLLAAANLITVTKLAGLFGGVNGNLDYRLADGSGYDPENPTLVEMTNATLTVLNRNPNGFVLMVEGGAVDWSGHSNNMNRLIGELTDFNNAVQAVINWVENPANGSSWQNTLVIVTGDHETGYLTTGPGIFPDQPLGEVSAATLTKEKQITSSGRRASWEDTNDDNEINPGETVYWAWNSSGHSNSLIPLYAKGIGANLFAPYATGSDSKRGAYIDNTDVFKVMDTVVKENQLPIASFVSDPVTGTAPLTVTFDASASSDPDGSIISYTWDFGDGSTGAGVVVSHAYTLTGTYLAALIVTDTYNTSSTHSSSVFVDIALERLYLPVILRK